MQGPWAGFQGHSNGVLSFLSSSLDRSSKEQVNDAPKHARTVSDEPVAAAKVSLHLRGSQSLDLAKSEPARAAVDYEAFTAARAALSAKKRREAKRVSKHSTGSVFASRHLCSKCQIFPLHDCLNSPQPGQIWTSPLKRLIWHKNDCPLCILLIRSLCETENDPFKHPLVSANLPDGLRKDTMATWLVATSLEETWLNTTVSSDNLQKWPFGIEVIETEKELTGATDGDEVAVVASHGFAESFIASTVSNDTVHPSQQAFNMQATSPCFIAISNNSTAPGVLDVNLWGYPRGPKAQIIPLSSFRLRIESDWPPARFRERGIPFSYGHILESDRIDLGLGRLWFDNCEHTHGHACSKQSWPVRLRRPESFRLVDVDDLSIIEISDEQVWDYRYLALSYVRGEDQTFQLLQINKSKLLRTHGLLKIFRHGLPKTVRDAILATRAFGERFLWVDSLCVIHDNEADVRQQLDIMDRIYGNALVTIVAADGEHVDVGLRGVEKGSRQLSQIYEEIESGIHMMLPLPEPKGLATSPWNNRAWTFQERLLSRRLAIFIDGRLVWRCHKTVAFEDMTASESGEELETCPWLSIKPQHLGTRKPTETYLNCSIEKLRNGKTQIVRSTTFKEYASLVTQYSQRRLQYSSDALRAFAGLSHVLELCFRSPMRQGLPENLLDAALLWRPLERLHRRGAPTIPSWSWAGWEGPVKFEDAFRINTSYFALNRVASDNGIEAFRPLLRFYSWRENNLELLNGNGLGLPLQSTTEELPLEWEKYPPMLSTHKEDDDLGYWDCIMNDIEKLLLDSDKVAQSRVKIDIADLPESILPHLNGQHLIFRTSCTQSIQFGRLKRSAVLDPKIPLQYPIIQGAKNNVEKQVGHLRLDGERPRIFDPTRHSLIVISEALYFSIEQSSEQEESSSDFPLYNVMLVEWNDGGTVASRLGLGRIYKEFWKSFDPPPAARVVVLR